MNLADQALPAPAFWPAASASVQRHTLAPRASGSVRGRAAVRAQVRVLALILVVAAHAAALYVLTRANLSPIQVAAAPLQVALIEAPQAAPPQAPPAPAPPEPAPPPAVKPKPVSVAKLKPRPTPVPVSQAPTALSAESPPAPEPPAVAAPAAATEPAPSAQPAPPAATHAAAGPSAPVVSAARFDADYLNNPPPAYPPLSRRMGEEGRVMLRVRVSAEGLPTAIELSESSGSARLDRAATDAVRRWRFVPARLGDQAVSAWVLVPIVFKLEGS